MRKVFSVDVRSFRSEIKTSRPEQTGFEQLSSLFGLINKKSSPPVGELLLVFEK